jgi:hypothetical protein
MQNVSCRLFKCCIMSMKTVSSYSAADSALNIFKIGKHSNLLLSSLLVHNISLCWKEETVPCYKYGEMLPLVFVWISAKYANFCNHVRWVLYKERRSKALTRGFPLQIHFMSVGYSNAICPPPLPLQRIINNLALRDLHLVWFSIRPKHLSGLFATF